MTHTKTFNLLNAWAETTPWDCLIRETGCISKTHDHSPMVNDECAWGGCDELLREREVCYAVIELKRAPGAKHEPWVCWRHVRPDEGPITVCGR